MNNLGKFSFSNKKIFFYFSLFFLISLLVLGFFMFKSTLQGKAIINLEGDYQNNSFNGNVLLDLKDGELIPSESILLIENNGESYEYSINQIIKESLKEGNYYLEDKEINGSGLGYGFYGVKKEYPEVYFKFYAVKENKGDKNETNEDKTEVSGGSLTEEIIVPENSTTEEQVNVSEEIVPEMKSSQNEQISEEVSFFESDSSNEVPSESTTEPSGGIVNLVLGFIQGTFLGLFPTGKISSEFENEISGNVKFGEEFKYKLNSNEKIKIVSGSVKTDSKELSENVLIIKIEDNELIISTSYFEETSGFGKDYIGENNKLSLDFTSLNLSISEGDLKISINYNGEEISFFETVIRENQTIIIEENNETNVSIEKNETILLNETNITDTIKNTFNLTNDELKILYQEFGNASVNSSSKLFKERVIVTFSLNSYESKYSYDSNLSNTIIQELIDRDRTNWLRDLARTLSTEESRFESLNKFNESFSLKNN